MSSSEKTQNIGLNKYKPNEFVKRQNFVNDNVRIDEAIGELKTKVNNITLVDNKISITDIHNNFTGMTLDKVLDELNADIKNISGTVDGIRLTADKVSYVDTHGLGRNNVQTAINTLANKLNTLEVEVNNTVSALNTANNSLETTIGEA